MSTPAAVTMNDPSTHTAPYGRLLATPGDRSRRRPEHRRRPLAQRILARYRDKLHDDLGGVPLAAAQQPQAGLMRRLFGGWHIVVTVGSLVGLGDLLAWLLGAI